MEVQELAAKPGPELGAALDQIDFTSVSDSGIVEVMRAAQRLVSYAQAVLADAVAEVDRRSSSDWADAEVAAALTLPRGRAVRELEFARVVTSRLPLVYAALRTGKLNHDKARVFTVHLADLDAEQSAAICERMVEPAAEWTSRQLQFRLRREVMAIDPEYARRKHSQGVEARGVHGYMSPDGTVTLVGKGLAPGAAAAAKARLEDLASAVLAAGHPASIEQIRADLYVRLLDGSYDGFDRGQIIAAMLEGMPSQPRHGVELRVGLSTLLGLDDNPADLPTTGPILAESARELAAEQGSAEWRFAITDPDGFLLHTGITTSHPYRNRPVAARGGVVELHITAKLLEKLGRRNDLPLEWMRLVADLARKYAKRGVVDLDSYPDARFAATALRRYIEMRDRCCVAPGCQCPAIWSELDHTIDYVLHGRTIRANLAPLCKRHHAMKSKGGWRLTQPKPGRFRWRSPLGRVYWTKGEPIAPDLPADRVLIPELC